MKDKDDLLAMWRKDRVLLPVVVLTLLLAPAILAYQMWLGYRQQIDIAEKTAGNVAMLLDAQLGSTLHRVDGALQEIVRETPVAALHAQAVPQHAGKLDGYLDAHLYKFGELNGFRIADAEGNVLYSSASASTPRANIGDRPYFRQAQDGKGDSLIFSEVIFGRTAKQRVMVAVRAIRNERGDFLGVVYAILIVDHFQNLFQSLNLDPDSVIELRRSDSHDLLVRWPELPEAVNQPLPKGHPILARGLDGARTEPVVTHLTDPLDGVERIEAVLALDDYPLVFHVGIGRNQALAEWQNRSWLVGMAMFLFLALVAMALQRFQQTRKEELQIFNALQDSETRFRQFFEKNDSVMFWIDAGSGCIVDANQAAVRFYGYPRDQLIGMDMSQINTLPRYEIDLRIAQARKAGFAYFEFRHRLASGEIRDVEVYTTAFDYGGKSLLHSLIHDITARHKSEIALRTERDRNQRYMDLVEAVIVALDSDGNILSINRKGEQLFDVTSAELSGRNWFDVAYSGELGVTGRAAFRSVMTGEQPLSEYYEYPLECVDGTREMAWHNALMYDEAGRVVGLLSAGLDITERKCIERELESYRHSLEQQVAQRTEELVSLTRRLTLATRAANIGVWEWEIATGLISWNEQMSVIYGVPHEPVAPAEIRMRLILPEDLSYVQGNMQVIFANGDHGENGQAGEFRIVRPDGEIRHLYSTGTVVRDEQGKAVCAVGINLDITDHKRTEEKMRLARDAAEASDRAKSEFLANVTHELRTPLNAVIGMTNLARDLSVDVRQRDYLEKILSSGKHLNRIINDLLDLTKIAAGHMEIESLPFSPRTLIVRCNSVMAHRAAEKGLRLSEIIDDDVPEVLMGDPLRIEQILLNLIGNAIKFTASGGVEVHIGIHVRKADRVCLDIAVRDTGIGMSDTDLERLFKPFSQADASVSRRFGGTGLGLAISKRFAELMGGDIAVSSRPGSGSTFNVRLWLALADPVTAPQQASEPVVQAATGIRYRNVQVLVVEDQPLNREIVEAILGGVGITACMAENGQEGLYILKKSGPEAFDLVLMDVQMPVMDGLSATRELRRWGDFGNLPVIAMTAHTMAHEKETAVAAGMNDHIGKPFDNMEFLSILAKWIASGKQERTPSSDTSPPLAAALPISGGTSISCESAASAVQRQRLSPRDVPGLDWQAGLARFNGKEDRYRHWLADFAATAGDTVASIRAEAAIGETGKAAGFAHTLKGRVGMLGMVDLHRRVSLVESALRTSEVDGEEIAGLERAVEEMRRHLAGALLPDAVTTDSVSAIGKIPWSDSFSVGVQMLDRQHRALLDLINGLADQHEAHLRGEDVSRSVHELLSGLFDHIELHFRTEEDFMRDVGYPSLAEHEREHAQLVETLAEFNLAKAGDTLDVAMAHRALVEWLNDHILHSDMQYRHYLDECNLNY